MYFIIIVVNIIINNNNIFFIFCIVFFYLILFPFIKLSLPQPMSIFFFTEHFLLPILF